MGGTPKKRGSWLITDQQVQILAAAVFEELNVSLFS